MARDNALLMLGFGEEEPWTMLDNWWMAGLYRPMSKLMILTGSYYAPST
jgi:hypothetical protein